jgi:hypothetical protein
MRVVNIALKLNVGTETILSYLNDRYINSNCNFTFNSILTEYDIKLIELRFGSLNDEIKTNEYLNKFLFKFGENQFQKEKNTIKYPNKVDVESIFTDKEVKNLCLKMANPKIRYLAKNFELRNANTSYLIRYQLHFLAMKAVDKFGINVISFIYNLNSLPTRSMDIKIGKLELDKKTLDPNITFPIFIFKSQSINCDIIIHFTQNKKLNPVYKSKISIYGNNKLLHEFSNKGKSLIKFTNTAVNFLIFSEIIDQNTVFYSGYDDGYCQKCGRRLTDKLSVVLKCGPVCRSI